MKNIFLIASIFLITLSKISSAGPEDCRPNRQDCVRVVCDRLGSFACNSSDEFQAANNACRGNFNGACVTAACNHLGAFGCNNQNAVFAVARACVNNYGSSCLESACRRMGTFGCDELSEVLDVAQSCGAQR